MGLLFGNLQSLVLELQHRQSVHFSVKGTPEAPDKYSTPYMTNSSPRACKCTNLGSDPAVEGG